ncbi:MUB1/samB family protein [Pleurotus pulmonarius]
MYRRPRRTCATDDGQTCAGCKLQAGSHTPSSLKDFKRCSACKRVWYCGPECQKDDWVRHIFDCDTNQEITTAHHLALAVRDKSLPSDEATLVEYGFTRAPTAYAKSQLLGVYVDLMEQHRVTTKRIHRWASEGELLSHVRATFDGLPEECHGSYYPWLLENMFVLDTSLPAPEPEPQQPTANSAHDAKRRRCNGCSLSEGDPPDEWESSYFATFKLCSGCRKVWYCSLDCQKFDWVRHIFQCKPRQPINTSHHLALAVHNNLLPEDPQTCEDYGFTKAFTVEARSKLLGVYIGLIKYHQIRPKTIHKWRIEGRLLEKIKEEFEQLPPNARGGYYPWLLENQYVLDESVPDPRGDPMVEMINLGLKYANMPLLAANESIEDFQRRTSELPKAQALCLVFATKLLSRSHPAPYDARDYINFGFCACTCAEEESELGRMWYALLKRCSFDELCEAYNSSSLLALFNKAGISISSPAIVNVLKTSPRMNYSVWDLKQFVIGTEDSAMQPIRPVWVDYGFINCSSDAERLDLKSIYKSVFQSTKHPTMDPLQLHQACISGKLFDFVGQFYTFKEKKRDKYARLFKNPYPLPDL